MYDLATNSELVMDACLEAAVSHGHSSMDCPNKPEQVAWSVEFGPNPAFGTVGEWLDAVELYRYGPACEWAAMIITVEYLCEMMSPELKYRFVEICMLHTPSALAVKRCFYGTLPPELGSLHPVELSEDSKALSEQFCREF